MCEKGMWMHAVWAIYVGSKLLPDVASVSPSVIAQKPMSSFLWCHSFCGPKVASDMREQLEGAIICIGSELAVFPLLLFLAIYFKEYEAVRFKKDHRDPKAVN